MSTKLTRSPGIASRTRLAGDAVGQLLVERGEHRLEVVVVLAGSSAAGCRRAGRGAVNVYFVLAVRRLCRILVDTQIQPAGYGRQHGAIGADQEGRGAVSYTHLRAHET